MAYKKKSYLEHTAFRVKDIKWHIRFFREALGMPIRILDGTEEEPKQAWTIGGLQLISDPGFEGPEGRMGHIAIMTEDQEAALAEVYTWGVTELPNGRNWVALPDGLWIEILQAKEDAVTEILAIKPWV